MSNIIIYNNYCALVKLAIFVELIIVCNFIHYKIICQYQFHCIVYYCFIIDRLRVLRVMCIHSNVRIARKMTRIGISSSEEKHPSRKRKIGLFIEPCLLASSIYLFICEFSLVTRALQSNIDYWHYNICYLLSLLNSTSIFQYNYLVFILY